MYRVLLAVMLSGTAMAIGVPRLSPSELAKSSDAIAIGDISDIHMSSDAPKILQAAGRTLEGREYSARFRVLRLVKGSLPQQLTLKYVLPTTFVGYRQLHPGLRILFLKASDNTYTFADPYHPDLPATRESLSWSNSGDLGAEIEKVMLAVLSSPRASDNSKVEILQNLSALKDNSELVAALRAGVANAADARIREILEAQLMLHGDHSSLGDISKRLVNNEISSENEVTFLSGIEFGKFNATDVPALSTLLRSGDASVRLAAVHALANIRSPATRNALLKSLNDASPEVRYWANRGLSDLEGIHSPTIQEFEANEPKYLAHWLRDYKGTENNSNQ